ncbi:MAG: hypothetical protein AVDCRST_MAG33-2822 [uncultured Thermomicrobiales bacterium]|uniref:YggT family protein n=1 Tax=uncultured Thermomicrobiales bacterium TaxID=1645740 RepID=A0A6J4VAX1_9BACT|nr:MAG: hypothetical protein AVDCRST_MAG33-2822 [uncultured Thermomicrobiales bacterium]
MQPMSPPSDRSGTSSQVALEVIVNLYAAAAVVFVARAVLLVGDVDSRVWIGRFVYRFTDPLVAPFRLLPGAERTFIGAFDLADLTVLAIIALIPLGLSLRHGRAEFPEREAD